MKNYIISTCICLSFFFTSCVDEISNIVPLEENTIVFGEISNQNKAVEILVYKSTLSTERIPPHEREQTKEEVDPVTGTITTVSKTVLENVSNPVNDAKISLYTLENNQQKLVTDDFTVKRGAYTSNQKVEGKVGSVYWIEVTLSNGDVIVSKKETIQPVIPIDSGKFEGVDEYAVTFKDPANTRDFYLIESIDRFRKGITNYASGISNDVLFNGNKQATLKIEHHLSRNGSGLEEVEIRLSHVNFSTYQFYLNRQKQFEENQSNKNEDENGEPQNSGSPDQLFAAPSVSLVGNLENKKTKKSVLGNFSVLSTSVIIEK